jgi:hypothetical protein
VISDPLPGTGQPGWRRVRVRQGRFASRALGWFPRSLQPTSMPYRCASPGRTGAEEQALDEGVPLQSPGAAPTPLGTTTMDESIGLNEREIALWRASVQSLGEGRVLVEIILESTRSKRGHAPSNWLTKLQSDWTSSNRPRHSAKVAPDHLQVLLRSGRSRK